jgi:autotransporter-associated beta strand protein
VLTVSGSIGGAGSLTKNGAGVLELSGISNGYLGGTIVSNGTLIVDNAGGIADGTSLTVGDPLAFQTTAPAIATPSATAVPEPSTLLLAAAAIAGAAIVRRRRR